MKRLSTVLTLVVSLGVFSVAQSPRKIVADKLTVDASHFKYVSFDVGNHGARVFGRFKAEGGSGSDIICLILSEEGFENYKHGHRAECFYNSEKVTVGKIDVELAEGTYYLVLSNGFSVFSNKVVDISLYAADHTP